MKRYEDTSIEELETRLEEIKGEKVIILIAIIAWLIFMMLSS